MAKADESLMYCVRNFTVTDFADLVKYKMNKAQRKRALKVLTQDISVLKG